MTASVVDVAATLVAARRYDDALQRLAPHLEQHPDDSRALCLGAQAFLGLGRNADAQAAARRAVTLRPQDAWPLRLLAQASAGAGHDDEAIDAARRAVAIEPNDWRCHWQLAYVRYRTRRVASEAIAAAHKARELAPDRADTHRMAGLVLAADEQRREARRCFQRALALDPQDAVSRHELARLQMRRGQLTAAANGFAAAVRLDPTLRVGVSNLDVVVNRAISAVSITVSAAAILVVPLRGPVVPAIVSGLVVAAVVWFRHHTGSRLDRYLLDLPRRQWMLTAAAVLVALGLGVLWVEALAPRNPWSPLGMLVAICSCAAATRLRRHWAMARYRRG